MLKARANEQGPEAPEIYYPYPENETKKQTGALK